MFLFAQKRDVENDIANDQPCVSTVLSSLFSVHGDFSSNYGAMQHVEIRRRFDVSYSIARLGYFITISCILGNKILHKTMCYFHNHMDKPLIFPASPKSNERVL